MVKARRQLVVGLPGSGKTTFIAALWHVMISDEIPTAFRLETLDGDRTHLNKIREAWLRCEPVPRTSQQAEAHVRMLLADKAEGVTEVWFPDMSGESFRDQWQHRQWPESYDRVVEQADNVLVFVHPDQLVEPIRIATMNAIARNLGGPAPGGSTAPARPTPWDARQAPTQVQLVELLQFLRWRRPETLWSVSIVVSAWDLLRRLGQTPGAWCNQRLPLLAQFLSANARTIRARYCGVSAQGGGLPADAQRLRSVERAAERIEVVREGRETTNDISVLLTAEDGS